VYVRVRDGRLENKIKIKDGCFYSISFDMRDDGLLFYFFGHENDR
jgi:hypothetical protein